MTLFRSHPDVGQHRQGKVEEHHLHHDGRAADELDVGEGEHVQQAVAVGPHEPGDEADHEATGKPDDGDEYVEPRAAERSEEHTSELQSLMRISYAVFCLKKKNVNNTRR